MARKKKQTEQETNSTPETSSSEQTHSETRMSFSERVIEILILSIIAVTVFLIYANNLDGPFVFDDEQNIRDNRYIRITELTPETLKDAAFKSHASNRPVANISFALNYYFHQLDMTGFHVVNILIHIATGLLLYFFVKATMSIEKEIGFFQKIRFLRNSALSTQHSALNFSVPLFTALVWLFHPIQTQSVSYIVQRMNSMAAMFYILSLLCYVSGRLASASKPCTPLGTVKKYMAFAGCVLSGILALGSKEIAGTLPFFILLYEWYFFQDLSKDWIRRYSFLFGGILILLVVFALLYIGVNPVEKILSVYEDRNFTVSQRVMTEFRVVVFYLSLLIFPHPSRLNLTHAFPISYSLFNPITTLLSLFVIAGLIAWAMYIAKTHRLISFCILWYFGNLVIESSVIGLEIIFEHRNYLPSMMLCLLAVLCVVNVSQMVFSFQRLPLVPKPELENEKEKPEIGNEKKLRFLQYQKGLTYIVLCTIIIVFAFWTHQRNGIWSSAVSLWKDCIKKSPENVRPYNNLGIALSNEGKIEEAMECFSKAIQIKPDYAFAHNNFGFALALQGKIEEAIPYYSDALRFKPGYVDANYNLGNAYTKQEKYDEAIRHYIGVLQVNPDHEKVHNSLGALLARQEKYDEAIYHYGEALRLNPRSAEAHNNMGLALVSQKKYQEAIRHYSEAVKIEPEYGEAYYNMGLALADQGKFKQAIENFKNAVLVKPDYVEAHNNLGNALNAVGNLEEAIQQYSEALKVNPEFADAHYNLGVAFSGQGKIEDAVSHYSEALRINPEFVNAHYNLGAILTRQGKVDEAIHHYREVVRISPDDADGHYALANLFKKQQNLKEAAKHYKETLRIKPDFAAAQQNLELMSNKE